EPGANLRRPHLRPPGNARPGGANSHAGGVARFSVRWAERQARAIGRSAADDRRSGPQLSRNLGCVAHGPPGHSPRGATARRGLVAAFKRSQNVENGPPAVRESASGGFMNFTNLKKESQPAVMVLLTGSKIDEPQLADEDAPDRYVDPAAAVKVPKFSRRALL